MDLAGKLARMALKGPILLYRYTLSPLVGWRCRHLPTCSEYALEAIDRNGAWKGGWLTLARLLRCHPWGSEGYDPVPCPDHAHTHAAETPVSNSAQQS